MRTILVVDDRALNREFLVAILKYNKYTLMEASNGIEALDVINNKIPDLIITDIIMPKMDGCEFVNKLYQEKRLLFIPVIFYTATYRLEDAALIAMRCGVKYVLPKPSEPQTILNIVKTALKENKKFKANTERKLGDSNIILNSEENLKIDPNVSKKLSDLQYLIHLLNILIKHTEEGVYDKEHLHNIAKNINNDMNNLLNIMSTVSVFMKFIIDLFAEKDIKNLIKLFCSNGKKIINTKHCGVIIFDQEKNNFSHYFISEKKTFNTNELSVPKNDKDFIKLIFDSRKILNININEIENIVLPITDKSVKGILGIPLLRDDYFHGIVYFTNKLDDSDFNEIDLQMIEVLRIYFTLIHENMEFKKIVAQLKTNLP